MPRVIEIPLIVSMTFNVLTAALFLLRRWQTHVNVYLALFFISLALLTADVLILLVNVNVYFVGPASGTLYALTILVLLHRWLQATRCIHSKRSYRLASWLIYALYAQYPACALVWFLQAMLPEGKQSYWGVYPTLYVTGVIWFGTSELLQSAVCLWLLVPIVCTARGGNCSLKRNQLIRLLLLSLLLVPPNLINFQLLYVSPAIWLVWALIALWPRSLVGMETPLETADSMGGSVGVVVSHERDTEHGQRHAPSDGNDKQSSHNSYSMASSMSDQGVHEHYVVYSAGTAPYRRDDGHGPTGRQIHAIQRSAEPASQVYFAVPSTPLPNSELAGTATDHVSTAEPRRLLRESRELTPHLVNTARHSKRLLRKMQQRLAQGGRSSGESDGSGGSSESDTSNGRRHRTASRFTEQQRQQFHHHYQHSGR